MSNFLKKLFRTGHDSWCSCYDCESKSPAGMEEGRLVIHNLRSDVIDLKLKLTIAIEYLEKIYDISEPTLIDLGCYEYAELGLNALTYKSLDQLQIDRFKRFYTNMKGNVKPTKNAERTIYINPNDESNEPNI